METMNYTTGNIGKAIVLRLDSGEPLYKSIEEVASREGISSGIVWVIGGIINGGVVVGPRAVINGKPDPMVERFDDPREILGFGTLFCNEQNQIKLHMHAGIGKGKQPLVGCPREGAECWLIDEVVIVELKGIDAKRVRDPVSGLELLNIGSSLLNKKE
jgi:uncharacterized protein